MTRILNYCGDAAQRVLGARCLLCRARVSRADLCPDCHGELPRIRSPHCRVCAMPLATGTVCGACLAHPPLFDRIVAACAYGYPVDRMVQRFKYGGELAIARVLARLVHDALAGEARADVIVPMPIARERLAERGFNQSLEIARVLAPALGIRLDGESCRRVRHAPAQANLALAARTANVRGAFVCIGDVGGLDVAVVDDVVTTGATLAELARVLKKAGARSVAGWVAARTLAP